MHDHKHLISLFLVAFLLTACGSTDVCDTTQPYIYSKAGAELVIPEGLDEPSNSRRLVVPDIDGDDAKRMGNCLSLPPKVLVAKEAVEPPPPPPEVPVAEIVSDRPLTIGPGFNSDSAEETIRAWAQSWADADVPTYLSFYSKDLEIQNGSDTREQWLRNRSDLLIQTGKADIAVNDISVENVSADRQRVRFVQDFKIPTGIQSVAKVVELVREGGGWRILSERVDQILE